MVKLVKTSKNTEDRLSVKDSVMLDNKNLYSQVINIDSERTYQTIIGFGGAFTEAAALTLSKVSDDLRTDVIEKYFDKEKGIGYSLGRVSIHSCDFALGNYTYVEEKDENLKTFNIEHDKAYIIPLIKDAMKKRGDGLTILASPWSPPAWMKSNNMMNQGGKLLSKYFSLWALYYTKFIKAYENEGINIWGITVQNEPNAVQIWDSCIYSAEEERDFIKKYLGPIFYREGLEEKKILIWDHNRDLMVERAKIVLEDKEAAKYIWGTGFHWYVSEEFENVGKVHDMFPDKHILFTEGCQEGGVKLGEWFTGERYGRNIIGDINNWCEGYIDWNLVLDETGGPNHVSNFCDAPVIVDTVRNKIHYNSSYYYIGHFSKFIDVGAKRIFNDCNIDKVYTAAFKNLDNSIIIVIMNESEKPKNISVSINGKYINSIIEENSIVTYIQKSLII